jgi:CelD/BcsL family acetyltransferase involved in cellulose biosynthesis
MSEVAVLFEPKSAVSAIAWRWPEVAKAEIVAPAVHCFEPLSDPRWEPFVEQHPRASVFHCSAWLEALHRTYGYKSVAYTTNSASEQLEDAIVFCRVESWLTGRRLVSLPFSDHCEPLMETQKVPAAIDAILRHELASPHWRYIELRPLGTTPVQTPFAHTGIGYAFHQLDLRPDLDAIFGSFHKSSIQRKIRRAEREGLTYREGSSEELLEIFYRLFERTRIRHRVPPQPQKWFVNLIKCFGPALKIRVASKANQPVAAMITLRHKETMVYKYGCSDTRFNNLGGMHLLFWNAIQEAKTAGLGWFDFGRTDADQQSLITFKNRWGATQSVLTYSRYGSADNSTHVFDISAGKWKARSAKYVLSCLPNRVISKVGQLLYGHVG